MHIHRRERFAFQSQFMFPVVGYKVVHRLRRTDLAVDV